MAWHEKYINLDHRIPDRYDTKDWTLIARRRAQLFEAATVVFGKYGYHEATMQEIAEEAGMGKGTMYEYVKGKKDLLFLVIEEGHLRLLENIKHLVEEMEDMPPEEKMSQGIRIQVNFFNYFLDAAKVLMPEVERMQGEDRERVEQLKSAYLGVFRQIYEEGVEKGVFREMDPLVASEVICNATTLWGRSDTIRERCSTVEEYEKFLVGLFMKGIQT